MNFNEAFVRLIGNEGRYNDVPGDPGGETNWGISKQVICTMLWPRFESSSGL
jgi:lysozyme family protein